jgi:hypothetical protein
MRVLSSDALAALDSGRFGVRTLVKVAPAGETPFCIWDDVGDLSYASDTYTGKAGRFTVSPYQTTQDLTARNVDVTFSGIDGEAVAYFLAAPWHQAPLTIARGIFAVDTPQTIAVTVEFAGFVDQMISSDQVGGAWTLVYRCESAAREFQRAGARTRSDSDQRQRDADDGFLKFATSAVNTKIDWGPVQQQARPRGIAKLISKIF